VEKKLRKYGDFAKLLGPAVKIKENLAKWTTLKIGGDSDLFYVVREPQNLIRAVLTARKLNIPLFILGRGSNLLVSDKGFKGLVVRNNCRKIEVDGNWIICQSGALLKDVVLTAKRNSLAGLEFAAGIWGTVGGAVCGNAGAFGQSIGDVLKGAVVLTTSGDIKKVENDFFEFGYRKSKLKRSGDIVLSATLKLRKGDRKNIEQKMKKNLAQRKIRVPEKENSAGCYFKNPQVDGKTIPAGKLLEQVGAKKLRVGDAAIYSKHANIMINLGKARAKDVKSLADILRKKVKRRFNIDLEEEVVFVG